MSMLQRLFKSLLQFIQVLLELPRLCLTWLQRLFMRRGRPQAGRAGFVLPTVTMVILVVVLTSTTLVFRSIDRAKNASNFRVNQVVMNAAAPAVERARAKVEALFADTSLPRGTPSDAAISGVFENDRYDLDDEVRLRIAYDVGGDGIGEDEQITTAWRFPVDTDNNGKYDTFTLYGVYYLSNNSRARKPFEARTRPQVLNAQNKTCEAAAGTSASLVGSDGWYNQEGTLKKAFYVYIANVPITSTTGDGFLLPTKAPYNTLDKYEEFQGNRGFTAMEYQQDRARIPLGNNAIVYEDDLDLSSGTTLRINGRILANSNLVVGEKGGAVDPDDPNNKEQELIRLYQVSDDDSCFYEEENGKILVGGNVSIGRLQDNAFANSTVQVDFFQGRGQGVGGGDDQNKGISRENRSMENTATEIAYNNTAYEARISHLVAAVLRDKPTQGNLNAYKNDSLDPSPVKTAVLDNSLAESELNRVRSQELERWFRKTTRRVPSNEVDFGNIGDLNRGYQDYGTDNLRPDDEWAFPTGQNTNLNYRLSRLPQSDPETAEVESFLGDRMQVGNNLPALWWDDEKKRLASEKTENDFEFSGQKWWKQGDTSKGSDVEDRYRKTQVQSLEEPGDTSRNGFWESSSAKLPEKKNDPVGGLRVVTGAGIYLPADAPATEDPVGFRIRNGRSAPEYVVWPDTMPQPPNPTIATNYKGGVTNENYLQRHPYRQKLIERYVEYPLGSGTYYPVYVDDEHPDSTDPNNPTYRRDLFDASISPTDIRSKFFPQRPYLKMRASAVYHYRYPDNSTERAGKTPIACVSSFYDPTDWKTAQNWDSLPKIAGSNKSFSGQLANGDAELDFVDYGFSNNGITYNPPAEAQTSYGTGIFNDKKLEYQANLVYPNGRPVNPALKKALDKRSQDKLTLADRSAIDAAYCGLEILSNKLTENERPTGDFNLVHGTIQELAFLDARQIKSIEKPKKDGDTSYVNSYTLQHLNGGQDAFKNNSIPQYDLGIEQRLPMEIRTTVIDLKKLRLGNGNSALELPEPTGANQITFPDREFMFPMSGIIYATRDDALPDASNRPTDSEALQGQSLVSDPITNLVNNEPTERIPADRISATDYWLDPTRRPNGIMLINGRELNRDPNNNFIAEQDEESLTTEKGLTLASNLPVYIKAQPSPNGNNDRPGFNIHQRPNGASVEEFTEELAPNWSNFYSRENSSRDDLGLDSNFACRNNDPRLSDCTEGDKWRVANVLSDAMTLLSERYRFGFRNEGDYDIRNNQSDNLFRDPKVLQYSDNNSANVSSERLHKVFWKGDPNQADMYGLKAQALWPADGAMATEYNKVVSGTDFDRNDFAEFNVSGEKKHIAQLRSDQGFDVNASLALNGLSSQTNIYNNQNGFNYLWPFTIKNPDNVDPKNLNDKNYSTKTNGNPINSSYFNNFVSPVIRRIDDRYEYLMETCLKLPVSQCTEDDWFAYGYYDIKDPTDPDYRNPHVPGLFKTVKASDLIDADLTDVIKVDANTPINFEFETLNSPMNDDQINRLNRNNEFAGTTAQPPSANWQHFPRRIAFLRATPRILGSAEPGTQSGYTVHYPNLNPSTVASENPDPIDPTQARPVYVTGIRTKNKTGSSGIREYWAPTPNNLILNNHTNTAQQRPVPLVIKENGNSASSDDTITCYHYDSSNNIEIFYADEDPTTGTPHVCGKFDTNRGDFNKVDNVLWYATSNSRANPNIDMGNKSTYNNNEFPLGLRNPTQYNSMYGSSTFAELQKVANAQPSLLPVMQHNSVTGTNTPNQTNQDPTLTNWLPFVSSYGKNIHYNLVMATGDTPPRKGEANGAVANLPRFLESWLIGSKNETTEMKGSFIQLKRSQYATAPFHPLYGQGYNYNQNESVYQYRQQYPTGNGKFAHYEPPARQWGFDVGILSQLPDLFSQQFGLPATDEPNEFYREVSRRDDWVKTLLCAVDQQNKQPVINRDQRPSDFCTSKTGAPF